MNKNQCSESKLYSLWNINGNKRYSVQKFINNGKFVTHIVFKDKHKNRDVIGKVVRSFSEGEVFHWPRLRHRSLAPLLDVVSIAANISILISTYEEINLREIIHDEDFINNPSCFAKKKIYLEDILWGLDYLHRNSLVLLNISDANISICIESNKAVITDFSCLKSICQAKKCQLALPQFYQAPEISEPNDIHDKFQSFNPIAAEMWAFGVMSLEVFFQHRVPWALVDYNCSHALDILNYIDLDTLKTANKGSIVLHEDLTSFKEFVKLFLNYYPYNRCDARRAALAMFLQPPKKRMAQDVSKNWSQQRNEFIEGKVTGDGSVRLNYLSPTKYCHIMPTNCSQQENKCTERKVTGDGFVRLNNLSPTKYCYVIPINCSQQENKCAERKETRDCSVTLNDWSSAKTRQIISTNYCQRINDGNEGHLTGHSIVEVNGLSSIKGSDTLHASKKLSGMQTKSSCRKIDSNTGLPAKRSREHLPAVHSFSIYDRSRRTAEGSRIRKVHSSNYPHRNKSLDKQKFDDGLAEQMSENMFDIRSLHSEHIQQEATHSDLLNQKIGSRRSHRIQRSDLSLDRSPSESLSTKRIEESRAFEAFKSSLLNLSKNNETGHNSNEMSDNKATSKDRVSCSKSKSLCFESFRHDSCKSYISLNAYSSKRYSTNQKKPKKSSALVQSALVLGDFKSVSDVNQSDISISAVNIKQKKSKKIWKCWVENENGPNEKHSHENLTIEKGVRHQNLTRNEKETDLETLFCQNQPFELNGNRKRPSLTNMIENSRCILRNRFHCPVHSKTKSSGSQIWKSKSIFQQSRGEIEREHIQNVEDSKKDMSLHLYKSGPLSNCYYSQLSESANPSHTKPEFSGRNTIVNFGKGNRKCRKKHSHKREKNGSDNLPDLMPVDGFTLNRSQSIEKKHKKELRKRYFFHIDIVSHKCIKVHEKDRQMGAGVEKMQNEKKPKESSKQRKVKCHKVKIDEKIRLPPHAEGNISQSKVLANYSHTMDTVTRELKNEKTPKVCSKQKKGECYKVNTDEKISLPPNDAGNISQICSEVHANGTQTIGTVARMLKNEKEKPEDCSKQKEVKCQKVQTEKTCFQQNGGGHTSQQTVTSRRSYKISTAECLNNPEEPETKDKSNDKRKSFKKVALYCLCLGTE